MVNRYNYSCSTDKKLNYYIPRKCWPLKFIYFIYSAPRYNWVLCFCPRQNGEKELHGSRNKSFCPPEKTSSSSSPAWFLQLTTFMYFLLRWRGEEGRWKDSIYISILYKSSHSQELSIISTYNIRHHIQDRYKYKSSVWPFMYINITSLMHMITYSLSTYVS